MRRRLPPLNALRAFEAAARHESFSLAAAELGVTPAAISRHVKLLEERFGRALFLRRPQSLSLTDFGRSWLPVVTEAFDLVESGTSRLLSPVPRQALSLHMQTAFAIGWMLPRFARFHREHPALQIRIYTYVEPPDLRVARSIDASIVHGRGSWPGIDAHFLFADRLVPVCSPSYLASRPALRDGVQLLGETLMVAEPVPDEWPDWFASIGHRGVEPVRQMAFANTLLPVQAAIHGLGFALADLSMIEAELAAGRLVAPLHGLPLLRGTGWYLAHAQDRRDDRAILALCGWLQREAGAPAPRE
jgi:LysR family glycine cleavage system transcriptional activator